MYSQPFGVHLSTDGQRSAVSRSLFTVTLVFLDWPPGTAGTLPSQVAQLSLPPAGGGALAAHLGIAPVSMVVVDVVPAVGDHQPQGLHSTHVHAHGPSTVGTAQHPTVV